MFSGGLSQVIEDTIERHKQNSQTFKAFSSSFGQDEDPSLPPNPSVSTSAPGLGEGWDEAPCGRAASRRDAGPCILPDYAHRLSFTECPRGQPGLMRWGCDLISGGSSLVPIWSTLGPRGTRRQGTRPGPGRGRQLQLLIGGTLGRSHLLRAQPPSEERSLTPISCQRQS